MTNDRMRRVLVAALVPLSLAGCSRDQETREEQSQPASERPATGAPAAQPGTGTGVTRRGADAALEQARADLSDDASAAGRELRQAAVAVRDEAGLSVGEARDQLEGAALGLDDLAARVENGSVKSERELDRYYARVHQALAMEFNRRAREAWRRGESRRAGEELQAAADHLDHALRYAGHETDQAALEVVRRSGTLAEKLLDGTAETSDEVEEAFTATGHEIERVGRRIEAAPRPGT